MFRNQLSFAISVTAIMISSAATLVMWLFSYLPLLWLLLLILLVTCETYELYSGICVIPAEFSSSEILVVNVTRAVCRFLCSQVYGEVCSAFLFNRTNSTCILSSYTGEWLQTGAPNCTNSSELRQMEFYRRKRCLGKKRKRRKTHRL